MTPPVKAEGNDAKFSVSGKTAIVTGAGSGMFHKNHSNESAFDNKNTSGINLAFVELLLARECNVVLADIALRVEAQDLIAKYQDNPKAVFVKTDVTSWPELSNMFETALADFGGFDIVCPGAGVYEPPFSNFWIPPGASASKDKTDGGHYSLLDINLTHPIRVTQLALSHWLYPRPLSNSKFPEIAKASPKNPKRLIHISSVAGQMPVFRAPLYAASKFGLTGFVRSLAPLDAEYGVRVNAVAPGVVRTPLWLEHPEKLLNVDQEKDGWVTPQEVAEAMLRCVEGEGLVGGTILEVGKDETRIVDSINDPGPSHDPAKGYVASNSFKGDDEVWRLIKDVKVWGNA